MKPSDEKKSFEVLGLGKVMLRLSPVGKERVSYCETFEKMAGGSELNVVAGISMLGMRTGIITKLPRNDIGKFIKHKIRYTGTSDDYIIYDDSEEKRLGVGIANTRKRLHMQCNGTLDMKLGTSGSVITITIPDQSADPC